MPSLQARSSFSGLRPLLFLSKVISFTVIVFFLCAGWVGVSYLKNHSANRRSLMAPSPVAENQTIPAASSTVRLSAAKTEGAQQLAARLVYSCASDKTYYHDAKHLDANCQRIAMSEETAASRGLKPCARCFKSDK